MKLAIKGHPKRGNEVIKILEILGGNNANNCCGKYYDRVYYINENGYINQDFISHIERNTKFIIFSLEEFLEKFPYKVGDKVKVWINGYHSICNIQNMQWDSLINEIEYKIQDYWYSAMNLQPYEEETMGERKYSELRMPLDDDDKLATEITISGNKIVPPDGYLIGKITQVDNGMIVEYVKKQPQYPKTYEECCEVIGINRHDIEIDLPQTYQQKMFNLFKLHICRDAYWKIAGEEMGLGKDWEQDYDDRCFIIANNNGNIHTYEYHGNNNVILAFPTKEMRDAFYNNFKDLIEQCKELL